MASNTFITYYEALAKMATIANKQTMFLAHCLHEMDFDKDTNQYLLDLSSYKKTLIMKQISPEAKDASILNLANQYLSKLQKSGIIRNLGRGLWAVDPGCFGQFRTVSKELRHKNQKVYLKMSFDGHRLQDTEVGTDEH